MAFAHALTFFCTRDLALSERFYGGTLGKVTNVGDSYVRVEIAPQVEITVQKPSIQTLLPKGTIKSTT